MFFVIDYIISKHLFWKYNNILKLKCFVFCDVNVINLYLFWIMYIYIYMYIIVLHNENICHTTHLLLL